jgi:hypothetical protein
VNNINYIYNFLIDIVKWHSILSSLLPYWGNIQGFIAITVNDC